MDITDFGVDPGVQFKLWSASLGARYRVQLLNHHVNIPFEYRSQVAKQGWHTLNVYYPSVETDVAFGVPPWGPAVTFDPATVYGLRIEPLPSAMSQETEFDLCIDDIVLAAPPAPAASPTGPPLVANFEDNAATTLWPGGDIVVVADDSGSTAAPSEWSAGAATVPGAFSDSVLAGCVNGTISAQNTEADIFPYVRLALSLAAEDEHVDVAPYALEQALEFDLRGQPGVVYSVRLGTVGIIDNGYYRLDVTPSSDEWQHYTAWFVGSGPSGDGTDELAQPAWADAALWEPERATFIDVGPEALEGMPQVYDFCVDNVRFR